jgi:RNA polymerase sigma-70 factor (ECF subfamily)
MIMGVIPTKDGRPMPLYARMAAAARTHAGFKCETRIDDSTTAVERTRLAVARAKEGDSDAFQYLYIRYSDNLYGYVRSIVRNDHEAEDVTQQVFAKLMTSLVKYDDRGIPFSAWLLRMARNVAIDHLRANRTIPTDVQFERDGEDEGVDLERSLTVRAALSNLTQDQRDVVILRHVAGLSPGEIADRMGRTEGSIHALHHRGRRALQRELEGLSCAPSSMHTADVAAA